MHQLRVTSFAAQRPLGSSPARLVLVGLTLALGVLTSSLPAFGQAPAPAPAPAAANPEPNWDVIRKAALSPIDRQSVQKWVAQQIDDIFAANDPTKPGTDFLRRVSAQVRAGDAAAPFREAMGQLIAEAFIQRYQAAANAQGRRPLGPVFVLLTLREFTPPVVPANYAATVPAFQAVLSDPAPAVRAQGAMGLQALLGGITAQNRTGLVSTIQKVASAESNPFVLGRFYALLTAIGDTLTQPAELQAYAQGLLGILNARLTRVEQGTEWPALADADLIGWLAGKARTLNNAQAQADIARAVARLMADSAFAHTSNSPPQFIRVQLERIVVVTEERLAELYRAKVPTPATNQPTPPTPSVADVLLQGGPNLAARVMAAVEKWVGSAQTSGALNPPAAFNLPPGLGIQRAAPTTSTAPA